MSKLLLTACLCLSISACQNIPRSFASMSDEELFAYNEDKPVLDQVYCVKEATTSSYIRKRICRTVDDWVEHNTKAMMALDVLNVGTGSVFGRSLD